MRSEIVAAATATLRGRRGGEVGYICSEFDCARGVTASEAGADKKEIVGGDGEIVTQRILGSRKVLLGTRRKQD